MKQIKKHIFENFNTLFILTVASVGSIMVLALRLKVTHSFFLIFLVWNLFLAAVPYFISSYLKNKREIGKTNLLFWSILWLLFLPNAPYIITDLIHLKNDSSISLTFDGILISMFAISGLLFYIHSLNQMISLFQIKFSTKFVKLIKCSIPFLTGYGIYLGRFERFNSWNIVEDPIYLFQSIYQGFTDSSKIGLITLTSIGLGIFLFLFTKIYNRMINNKISV